MNLKPFIVMLQLALASLVMTPLAAQPARAGENPAREIAAATSPAGANSSLDAANQDRIAKLEAERAQREADLAASLRSLDRLKLLSLIGVFAVLALFTIALRARNRVSEANVKLSHAARHDALTGLPNRRFIRELLHEHLAKAGPAGACALMLVDLDRFKAINDTLGHDAGDSLLIQVGERLGELLPEGAFAARLGGDEFAALVPGCPGISLEQVAREIVTVLSLPYVVDCAAASIGASVGVAVAGPHADTVALVTRNADLALYHSKNNGRGRHTFFDPSMLAEAEERRRMEAELRVALAENQLCVAYQPIVDAEQGHVVAYEALVRWQHPTRGEIMPSQFIGIAEEAGLIRHIDDWVLRTACSEAVLWPEHVTLAVNLSAVQVEAEGLVPSVVSALARSGLEPERLEFEVNESVFLREGRSTARTLEALRSLGVRLALDDFGTGYSSLGYLRRAQVSKIKIDRSFVGAAAAGNSESLAIVKAIVAMARGLGMAASAEGVETEAELRLVRELGCTQIQGYLVGRPEVRRPPTLAPPADSPGAEVVVVPPARRRRTRAA